MKKNSNYDVIIIGGSYAGLAAAMSLGRAMRRVLLIDSGLPCNRQTPHSHNFLSQDGEKPSAIAAEAKAQVLKYDTVNFLNDRASSGRKVDHAFEITTASGASFTAEKLVFATGVKDVMPDIHGFSACWGISVLHCPYCHGYEVKNTKTAIFANGDAAFHYAQLLHNWTKDLTLFTNGKATLTAEQTVKINKHAIPIVEKEIAYLKQEMGYVKQIVFKDESTFEPTVIYARPAFEQHCAIPEMLGCELTEQGLLFVDTFQQTNVPAIYACGDNCSAMRSVANAVATGSLAGAMLNNELTKAEF